MRPRQHQFELLYVDARIVCGTGQEVLPYTHGLNGGEGIRRYICCCCNRLLDCLDCLDFLNSESRIHRFENFHYCII
jgi:hypothetical protein